jgi:solute carrier family 25 (mitochondrial carnitine/acylcarnitine transporter), member 20/29
MLSLGKESLGRNLSIQVSIVSSITFTSSIGTKAKTVTTIDGTVLEIVATPNKTIISNADLLEPDIYASNGVLHTVSSLLIPPGSLRLTPEKFLLTLNCTSFVSMLHSVNLTSLINDTETKYTILAPTDDVLLVFGDEGFPERGSEDLKKALQYHFLPGRWDPERLVNSMLVETALEEPGLDGGRQVLHVEVTDSGLEQQKKINFGGAGTIGEPS